MATDPGTWNRYAYVGGDPTNKNDPSGLDAIDDQSVCRDDGGCEGCLTLPSAAFLGDEGCESGIFIPVATPVPTCEDKLGLPSVAAAPQLAVLLGENSWGLGYPSATVAKEDLYMLQAMYNYSSPSGSAGTVAIVDASINTDTYRGYPQGVDTLMAALASAAVSSLCKDLLTAENAYSQFWNGSHTFSNVNQWRSVASHGSPGPGQIQLGGTVFFDTPGAHSSPGRPVRRPTPPTVLPPGKPRPEAE
jgi:hypothetical protein